MRGRVLMETAAREEAGSERAFMVGLEVRSRRAKGAVTAQAQAAREAAFKAPLLAKDARSGAPETRVKTTAANVALVIVTPGMKVSAGLYTAGLCPQPWAPGSEVTG